MTELKLSDQLDSLTGGVDALYIVARSADLENGWPLEGFSDEVCSWAKRLAEDAKPGREGGPAKTLLPGDAPGKLVVIALHDTISRHLSPTRSYEISSHLRGALGGAKGNVGLLVALEDADHALGTVLGIGRSLPLYTRKTAEREDATVTAVLRTRDGVVANLDDLAPAANAVRLSQRLVDMPTAELDCAVFEREARAAVDGIADVTVDSVVGDDLLEKGLRGLHAVGRTAMVPPRIVVLDYNPPDTDGTVALVGKGLVYDTGGLSLKIVGDRMLTMKCDWAERPPSSVPSWCSPVVVAQSASSPSCRWPKTPSARTPTVPMTSSRCTAARPSRSTTPTPKDAWSWPMVSHGQQSKA